MSVRAGDEVPTGFPSLLHAQALGAEPPAQVTDRLSDAPAATTGPDGVITQLDGMVTPVPESAVIVPVTVLQRVD